MQLLGTMPAQYANMTIEQMEARIEAIKARLGSRLFLPAHHYQKDEVVQFADATGDSLQLARLAEQMNGAEFIVFCGVHFMAETADMLTRDDQLVILPDMRAGCSMADMADIDQTEIAWEELTDLFGDDIIPITYVNSTAAIKAFVGKNGGATVTSSNAHDIVRWALETGERIMFLPDQHLGRNTAFDLGVPLAAMAVWDPLRERLDYKGDIEDVRVILWKGHCSVHEKFNVAQIEALRKHDPERRIIVHPECTFDVVQAADEAGSTSYIIDQIEASAPGTKWAVGTEMNLVNRLAMTHPEQDIVSLNPYMCPCLTMNRIDLPHLLWALESLETDPVNIIRVDEETTKWATLALERMLAR
ncbi:MULTISPECIES: quinolinate synthase NadA [unclassified Exiguobacterium]|uniref:quinolinate synthase NadA n=1 Tax=unclassified Exiguobacterium TaxID=2644629 RepID=UPI00103A158B|nr:MULTISPECIES: quinolinate synthase NadA [unclassified Exiguobacterium]TCI37557.1 quinolinate synthase NadA [Exiguobacterium sp. SH4S7]TCI45889.1 quinolinate synthase NadA [Exiguobacterium sp. SH5S32]TCI51646.1 quinolinate synthase NadA [Exiguobacterium sp. SH1S4]TCI65664.1 quinolinate synthase NadA [Exiguobacterium sp. SH0S2]TCI66324.1 quinolinate synthase NadA [Exiguobacterium sp. SH3S1]